MPGYTKEQYEIEKANGTRRENGAKPLKRLKSKHLRLIALHLQGYSNQDIAEAAGVSQAWLSIILSDPLTEQYLSQFRKEQEARLTGLYARSLDAVQDSLEATLSDDRPNHSVRLKGADLAFKLNNSYEKASESVLTAEDVIERMLQVNVGVQINAGALSESNEQQIESQKVLTHGDD